ncbi:MAG: tRNA 2-thiouridine(34) synthase MnmA [Candidatus Kaiserbacteria bacterium]|nr:tRNA 2-thiouridine(34) synthase MnmA [Candidatus Kaiserbacteria bacterium]MCB9815999.1 tRNA 2-thiouridine(34) synthase MnmA [Candidatus Nomurabacteria bacterium]
MQQKETVFVGLSGGVDSSVAAARLLARGYEVVGVFIKVWHPDFMVCNWEQERLDAMRVAAHLGIPFLTCDAEAAYRDEVAQYFIEEYRAGRTPNPDVMCNQHVKFGAFLRFAKEKGATYIATGHYAQRVDGERGPELHRGVDSGKDQTYFLWSLGDEQLGAALFPVGDTPKEQIRKEAEQLGIPVADKKDSQGICFLGHVDIPEFLSHYIDLEPGNVLSEQGEAIGTHKGALVYTLGQRHGFTLNTHDTSRHAMFVTSRDIENNTITVGEARPSAAPHGTITLTNTTLRSPLSPGNQIEAQFRYRQTPFKIEIISVGENELALKTLESTEQPAAGQSCVLYEGQHCLGGGTVL